jgi:hypothetical protein
MYDPHFGLVASELLLLQLIFVKFVIIIEQFKQ